VHGESERGKDLSIHKVTDCEEDEEEKGIPVTA
jgi:hypothetical protein